MTKDLALPCQLPSNFSTRLRKWTVIWKGVCPVFGYITTDNCILEGEAFRSKASPVCFKGIIFFETSAQFLTLTKYMDCFALLSMSVRFVPHLTATPSAPFGSVCARNDFRYKLNSLRGAERRSNQCLFELFRDLFFSPSNKIINKFLKLQ